MRPIGLLTYPDPFLRQPAREITDEEFAAGRADGYNFDDLIAEMTRIMTQKGGVGLAAPQVGVGLRIWIAKNGEDVHAVFNPRVSWAGACDVEYEGCLSIPNVHAKVERNNKVKILGQNSKGTPFEMTWDGAAARTASHENDHLDGMLFIDHVSNKDGVVAKLSKVIPSAIGDPIAEFVKNRRRIAWKNGGDVAILVLDPLQISMIKDNKNILLWAEGVGPSASQNKKGKRRKNK